MEENKLPRDEWSIERRGMLSNPGAIGTMTRIDVADFYGNFVTWTIDTFRVDGQTTTFVQRMKSDGGDRFVLPARVMEVLLRHDGQLVTKARRHGAQKALATRRARGDSLGNPEALARARKRRKK